MVAAAQLRALGLTRGAVEQRLTSGRLHVVHRAVYAVGRRGLTRDGHFMAAVLAAGPGATLSHRSAAAHWGLLGNRAALIDVTVPSRGGRMRRRGLVLHRSPLAPSDVTSARGIPVTTPGRTLVDLADVAPRRARERAIDEAERLRLDCSGLSPRPGRRGRGMLAAVLVEHQPGSTLTRSPLEERMLALCRRYGLPRPLVNAQFGRYEVDFLWSEARLVVESDGHESHGTRRAFAHDRRRDAELVADGYRVVRVTHRRLARQPAVVAGLIRRLLGGPGQRLPGPAGRARPRRRRD